MTTIQESEEKIDMDYLEKDNLDSNHSQESETNNESSLGRVIEITKEMGKGTTNALDMINTINRKTEFLAINALIEASRAGDTGKGFQVVAESIDVLATKTKEAVEKMRKETISKMDDLCKIIQDQSWRIQGNRLSDLALTNIDLIDRNLFERTADIRWWATDEILVSALVNKNSETSQQAVKRLGVILKSYTVYFDLILVDENGVVIANALQDQFNISGQSFAHKLWFVQTMKTSNGDEYGFQGIHKSSASKKHTLTFTCKVHENGDTNRNVVGVLAAIFNWDGLAQRIVNETPLSKNEKTNTRVCIVDEEGTVFADTENNILKEKITFPKMDDLFKLKKGFFLVKHKGDTMLACHGFSPGYEGYSSGWHSLILQKLENK